MVFIILFTRISFETICNIYKKNFKFLRLFSAKKYNKIFKLKINNKMILVDVGAHHGETIKLFSNNFNIHEIHSF